MVSKGAVISCRNYLWPIHKSDPNQGSNYIAIYVSLILVQEDKVSKSESSFGWEFMFLKIDL